MEETLGRKKNFIFWVILISIPISIFVVCPHLLFLYSGISFGDYSFRKDFESIKLGDDKNNVLKLIGQPDEKSKEFHLGQYQGFEEEYKKALESGSEYYLFWYRGIAIVYAVGFNKEDEVLLKSSGGT